MYCIQVFLPLCNGQGRVFPAAFYQAIKANLSDRFNGLTSGDKSSKDLPSSGPQLEKKDQIVYEVRTESLDIKWWQNYRAGLEKMFDSEAVVIRSQETVLA